MSVGNVRKKLKVVGLVLCGSGLLAAGQTGTEEGKRHLYLVDNFQIEWDGSPESTVSPFDNSSHP